MVTDDLLAYIRSQFAKNTPIDTVRIRLLSAGWESADVDAALIQAQASATATPTKPAEHIKPLDPYREMPTETMSGGQTIKITPPVMVTPKVTAPVISVTPKEQQQEVKPVEPKIWTPMQAKPVAMMPSVVETQAPEIAAPVKVAPLVQVSASPAPIKVESVSSIVFDEPVATPVMGTIVPQVSVSSPSPLMPQGIGPSVKPEVPIVATSKVEIPITPSKPTSPVPIQPISTKVLEPVVPIAMKESPMPAISLSPLPMNPSVNTPTDILSKKAMMSTFASDISSANKTTSDVLTAHKSNFKKLGIIVLIVFALFGIAYAFMSGIIKLPNFSVVKKDPKVLLANNTIALAARASYKADTTLVLSTPAVANITSGLMNGQQVTSHDTDSITLVIHRQVTNSPTAHLSDNVFTVSSSLLKNNIASDIKYDGTQAYIEVPDLHEVLGDTAPTPATVSVGNGEWGVISSELPASITDVVKRIDVYDIASKGVPPFVFSELSSLFDGFIQSVSITDKGSETLDGLDTYHYTIIPDHTATKQFLSDVLNIFVTTLSPDMKANLDSALGAVQFNTFDIWVGKSDDMIHKYSVVLTAPLSKVIALDDKGIAGNVVKFSIETTYHDFDVPNEITIPTDATSATDFAHGMHDARIKSALSSLSENTKILSHADGGYGKISNLVGSCVSPKSGSLFSPLGHAKGAATSVGAIASSISTILGLSGGAGSCFSTSSAWAVAVPTTADPNTSYCTDSISNGAIATLSSPLSGTICK